MERLIEDLRRECSELAGRVQGQAQLIRVLLRRLALDSADPVAELDAMERRALAFTGEGDRWTAAGPKADCTVVQDEISSTIVIAKSKLT
jgi:hypothetical protein